MPNPILGNYHLFIHEYRSISKEKVPKVPFYPIVLSKNTLYIFNILFIHNNLYFNHIRTFISLVSILKGLYITTCYGHKKTSKQAQRQVPSCTYSFFSLNVSGSRDKITYKKLSIHPKSAHKHIIISRLQSDLQKFNF